ncbi:MAG: 2Fe-2S iron-sulfur cluster-binding protein [Porticoccaceae bacterium]|nr:2Fe-2S iron-sulfur cluster binding domain-containing protein [Pseudomonadales bacterium]MCP5172292.1 2Fe-2S iron-sulfur cluster binding domain-containing protein [Pseudomonadales bacterium]
MTNFHIRLADDDKEYGCEPGQALLDALLVIQNKKIAAGCRSGGCGICKIQVLEGSYRCGSMSKSQVSDEELAAGITLACKTYPESDLLVKPYQSIPKGWLERISVEK